MFAHTTTPVMYFVVVHANQMSRSPMTFDVVSLGAMVGLQGALDCTFSAPFSSASFLTFPSFFSAKATLFL